MSKYFFHWAIKPEMRVNFNKALIGQCHIDEIVPDFDAIRYHRTCCKAHRKYDARTPGLFKREDEKGCFIYTQRCQNSRFV